MKIIDNGIIKTRKREREGEGGRYIQLSIGRFEFVISSLAVGKALLTVEEKVHDAPLEYKISIRF